MHIGIVMWNGQSYGDETVKRLRNNQAFQRDLEAVKEGVLEIMEQSKKSKND